MIMFQFSLVILVAGVAGLPTPLQAYQVWTSTAFTPNYVLDRLPEWDAVAAGVQGLNINFTPIGFLPGEKPDTNEWKQILQTYTTGHQHGFQPLARWGYESTQGPASAGVTLDAWLQSLFDRAASWGYTLDYVMLYDSRSGDIIYYWQQSELADVRSWLDNNGHANVKIMWDVRSDLTRERDFATDSNINDVLIEAGTESWRTNFGSLYTFLPWIITNSTKKVVFQIPLLFDVPGGRVNLDTNGNPTAYEDVRLFVRSLSATILGSTNFLGSDRCVFLPITYTEAWDFLPQYDTTGDNYPESAAGLLLSLMEQKARFIGADPGGLISVAGCKSHVRTDGNFVAVANGNLTNTATWNHPAPVLGEFNSWQTGSHVLGANGAAANTTIPFNGKIFVV